MFSVTKNDRKCCIAGITTSLKFRCSTKLAMMGLEMRGTHTHTHTHKEFYPMFLKSTFISFVLVSWLYSSILCLTQLGLIGEGNEGITQRVLSDVPEINIH